MLFPADPAGSNLVNLVIVFLVFCTIFVALRTWVRLRIQKAFHIDDWFALLTLLIFYGQSGLEVANVFKGYGKDITELTLESVAYCLKIWWIEMYFYLAGKLTLRLSIGLLVVRVIPEYSVSYARGIRLAVYSVMLFALLLCASFTLLWALACHPHSYFWTRFDGGEGYCVDTGPAYQRTLIAYSALSGMEDLAMALIPGGVIWQLWMSIRSKLLIHCLMGMGCVAGVGNWVRVAFFSSAVSRVDFIRLSAPITEWSTAEIGLGLVASSAATLRPLFQMVELPKFLKPERSINVATPPSFTTKRKKHDPLKLRTITVQEETSTPQEIASSPQLDVRKEFV